MPQEVHREHPHADGVGIRHPFHLLLEHEEAGLQEMFEIAHAFDMYELGITGQAEAQVKEWFVVDVLESTPTNTLLRITPRIAAPYAGLLDHVDTMLNTISRRLFEAPFKVLRVEWEVAARGEPSDERAGYSATHLPR